MAIAHLNIGSNIGDRHALIGQAVAAVEHAFSARAVCSRPFESEPWGFDSPNTFINIGVNIEVGSLAPLHVLRLLRRAERAVDAASHRDSSGAYIDRRIDIDLIALDNQVVDTPELTLPHPRMSQREFVLVPMAELMPLWRHPQLGLTPREMLQRLEL